MFTGGQDIKVSDERFEYGRNFANKVWNASRFVLMNLEGIDDKSIDFDKLTVADKWILDKLNNVAKEVNENIKNYRIGEVAHVLYDFFWNSYCDWYVEIAKIQLQDSDIKLNTQRVLRYVLDMSLRMLHPVMPFITEKIYSLMPNKEFSAIIRATYPVYDEKLNFPKENKEMELVIETIKSLRNVRQSFNISPSVKVNVEIRGEKSKELFNEKVIAYLNRLARIEQVSFADDNAPIPPKSATTVVSDFKLYIPLEDLIDLKAEIERQNKKLEKLTAEENSLLGRLRNENFVKNAKPEVVEETKAKADEIAKQKQVIEALISTLS